MGTGHAAVTGLDDIGAHLRNNTGGQLKEPVRALHLLAHSHNTHGWDAVFHTQVDCLRKVLNAGQLPVRADKGLDGHTVCIHTDCVFNVNCQDLMG